MQRRPHQRGMHQSLQAGALAPPDRASHRSWVNPSRHRRACETVHRAPPEQGLKPHLRGDRIHRSGSLKQARRMTTIRTQANAGMGQILSPEMS